MKVACAHDGCLAMVNSVSKTGLCRAHYDSRNSRRINCGHCGKRVRGNKSGLCGPCYYRSASKRCVECSAAYSGPRRQCGRCKECYQQSRWSSRVPQDRKYDYWILRGRKVPAPEAVARILAGEVVTVKKRPRLFAKVTVPSNVALKKVADALRISEAEILSGSRFAETVDARSVVAEIMLRQGMSYPRVGRRLNRDHSSIINLHRKFPHRASRRPILAKLVDQILEAA
ncbi:hypothetical protein Saro_3010 [Novosphingobium aromaticivorans DSM 12444]|uniref:Chromosomal replication initiator DnaA C-terminal domain-containing protein n=1 Tax=Novosphingobium aromaticivorans (strain ATCC 700278 / DSM 12444 / CCUG 56034 / CIP 105152 / NBRC 16084 / F199) TaxID=279238 RepID=Q2G3X8_NOVAD|nr:helix-turn-helix domain-containing protein [Novosphingobium aromaticivorans]ABD27445.1 hypothetical protein Saro_3010 [Novosphingobium aromaticivorans DSM 12444]SCY69477.1 dnaA protein helix-turn-helix [Novosphingobium aromaticivorans]